MQIVFQDPFGSLNPRMTVGQTIEEGLRVVGVPGAERKGRVEELLEQVGISAGSADRYPHEFSGGQRQRVGVARALSVEPSLIICDEPVSALDVSVAAAVINLLLEIQQTFGSSMIFIAHDLSVVRYFSDDIAVMYLGHVVEIGPADDIYKPPYHPYTEALLSAVPVPDPQVEQQELRLSGNVPSALSPPKGCVFHTRCPRRLEMLPDGGKICEHEKPSWQDCNGGHRILCHIPAEELKKMDAVVSRPAA